MIWVRTTARKTRPSTRPHTGRSKMATPPDHPPGGVSYDFLDDDETGGRYQVRSCVVVCQGSGFDSINGFDEMYGVD